MKSIIVNDKNKDRINEIIKAAEGRSVVRTIDYDTIVRDIKLIESLLCIPKKSMIGITAHVDHNAQKFPRAYKYTAESTHYYLTRADSGWLLYLVERDDCLPPNEAVQLMLTEEAKAALVKSRESFAI